MNCLKRIIIGVSNPIKSMPWEVLSLLVKLILYMIVDFIDFSKKYCKKRYKLELALLIEYIDIIYTIYQYVCTTCTHWFYWLVERNIVFKYILHMLYYTDGSGDLDFIDFSNLSLRNYSQWLVCSSVCRLWNPVKSRVCWKVACEKSTYWHILLFMVYCS